MVTPGTGLLVPGPHRRLTSPAVVRELLSGAGLRPRRGYGQNFLVDANVLRITTEAAALEPFDTVIEVGAGLGALTQALVEQSGKVYAIETDERLAEILERELAYVGNLVLIRADAMDLDPASLWQGSPPDNTKMVSNLPYQIAATLLVDWLRDHDWVTSYTVMVQREVADRITGGPGGKDYSGATVKIQYRAEAHKVASVSRNSFYPRPQVDSAIVHLRRRAEGEKQGMPRAEDEGLFDRLVTAAFQQRRKKLANAVSAGFPGLTPEVVARALGEIVKPAGARAEELSPAEFALLSNALARRAPGITGRASEGTSD